jgi:hypothetical protein
VKLADADVVRGVSTAPCRYMDRYLNVIGDERSAAATT